MTTLPIPSGPTHKEIIDRAYQALGMSDAMFGRTEEEYADALLALGAMAEEWPFDQIGFVIEDAAGLRVEEESGISRRYLTATGYALAERIAPVVGKSLAPEARKIKNQSYSVLCAEVSITPRAEFTAPTIRGAGARRYGRAFFPKAD